MVLLSGGVRRAENVRSIQVDNRALNEGRHTYEVLPAEIAVRLAWTDVGYLPKVLAIRRDAVREIMPNLARALDRLSQT
jgi:hypothetical protein